MSNLSEYAGILNEIKQEIFTGRHKAILAANKELVLHYWSIGNIILRHQSAEGWGSKVIDKLAQDLASEFPGTKGFSSRNLKYMRRFAEEYADLSFVQEVLAQITWYHIITFREEMNEVDMERQLVQQVTKLLLEFGTGFAFVGNQVHLEVGEEDFYLDLLFYHTKLRCYVVIELKTGQFKPEYAGKLNFYLSAVDGQMKSEYDNPSIGIILCKEKNRIIAEYALKDMAKPIGVSEYKLLQEIPMDLKSSLPSIEELEGRLENELVRSSGGCDNVG